MRRTRIKMCGTRSVEDAKKAIEVGVDALGFIFFDKSARFVSPSVAREIIIQLPVFVDFVGVFVDMEISQVIEIAKYSGINHVQLHGQEDPEYCQILTANLPSCRIIKAFRVGETSIVEDFTPYNKFVSAYLLDTFVKGEPGGTGKVFDWRIVKKLKLQQPVILAGGLNTDNITEAITSASPYAIDINSGVEISPGLKDYGKLERLVKTVRSFDSTN